MSSYNPGLGTGGGGGGSDASALEVHAIAGNAITNIPDNVLSTIVTFTGIAAKILVASVTVSGTVYAKYQLFFNTVLMETRRGGPDRTLVFIFDHPLKMASGDILDVKVEHYNVGDTADFDSTVYGG